MTYRCLYNISASHGEKTDTYIEIEELNEDRLKYLQLQIQNGGPILFCNCSNREIPMILTRHKSPHFLTRRRADQSRHYPWCRHFIASEDVGVVYKPAIVVEADGSENAIVEFGVSKAELEGAIDNRVYRKRFSVIHNDHIEILQGKMSWQAFIAYENMLYFKKCQIARRGVDLFDIKKFNRAIYGYLANQVQINGSYMTGLDKGTFFYFCVESLECIKGNRWRMNPAEDVIKKKGRFSCTRTDMEKAMISFEQTHHVKVEEVLERRDMFVICFGFKNEKVDYPICTEIGLMLVNKNGLFSESPEHALLYNQICDYLVTDVRRLYERYIFYKPVTPENEYTNLNFVADGIIRRRNSDECIAVEAFRTGDAQELIVMNEKKRTKRTASIMWEAYKGELVEEFLISLYNFM